MRMKIEVEIARTDATFSGRDVLWRCETIKRGNPEKITSQYFKLFTRITAHCY